MIRMSLLAATALLSIGTAASATSYDAFSSFDGTINPAANFTYGVLNGTFTPFASNAGCADYISNTVCLNTGGLPAVFKTTSGAHQSGTVIVPGDALIFHPGPDAGQSAAVEFVAPTAGLYTFSAHFFTADSYPNPGGVQVGLFVDPRLGTQLVPGTIVSKSSPSFTATMQEQLKAGEFVGLFVSKTGNYYNDSTGVNFTVTGTDNVPEPATLALLCVGMGVLGMTRRR